MSPSQAHLRHMLLLGATLRNYCLALVSSQQQTGMVLFPPKFPFENYTVTRGLWHYSYFLIREQILMVTFFGQIVLTLN